MSNHGDTHAWLDEAHNTLAALRSRLKREPTHTEFALAIYVNPALLAAREPVKSEYQRAMENHLCVHDMADWLACSGAHAPRCEVCEEADKGLTGHALRAEVDRLTALLASAPAPEQKRDHMRCSFCEAPEWPGVTSDDQEHSACSACIRKWATFFLVAPAPAAESAHASVPKGYRCSDCTIDGEACPNCYRAAWERRHPNVIFSGGRHYFREALQVECTCRAIEKCDRCEAIDAALAAPAAPEGAVE